MSDVDDLYDDYEDDWLYVEDYYDAAVTLTMQVGRSHSAGG